MGLKVTNNAFGTLNAGINSSATTIVLAAGQGARFPSLSAGDYFYATLIDTSNNLEIVKVTARSTDTMTVVRGQDSTTARAYSTNDRFELRPTAALFNELATTAEGALPKSGGTVTGGLIIDGTLTVETQPTGNGGYPIYIKRSATNKEALLSFQTTGNDSWFVGLDNDSTNNFYLGSASAFPSIKVDGSGRITTPYQPAFCAFDDGSSSYGANSTVVFNTVKFNTGSHYSNSTGRFTAPIAGRYLFYSQMLGDAPANTRVIAYISYNGSTGASDQTVEISATTKDYNSAQATTIMNLAAGDYVSIIVSPQNSFYAGSSFQNIFCGYLIG